VDGFGATARCADLPEGELKFIVTLRENFFLQHVIEAIRQRGSDTLHTLDLILTTVLIIVCLKLSTGT